MVPPRQRTNASARTVAWHDVELAPLVLVKGSEGLLADRAMGRLLSLARQRDPEVEVTRLDAAGYTGGELAMIASPSLFEESRHVQASGLESMNEAFESDLRDYLADPAPDVTIALRHAGGNRGSGLLAAIAKAGYPVVACDPLKRDTDKAAFVSEEFGRARRRVERQAVTDLVDSVGSDLRELAAACAQLISDTSGAVTAEVVDRYHGGRVEASGFKVADAAIAGDPGQALTLLRHAHATGTDPVPIVAALAMKLRTMAKVAAARGRGPGGEQGLGLAPWQVDRARRDLAGWTPEALASAISAVAAADAQVKGESRDPLFAVERAVLRIVSARRGT